MFRWTKFRQAKGGVEGGKVIGATDAKGSATVNPGWTGTSGTGQRDGKLEDTKANILSVLGINWANVRYVDPFGRGFKYVPHSGQNLYGPMNQLCG